MEQKRKLIRRIAVFLVIAIIFGSVGRYNYGRAEIIGENRLFSNIGDKEGSMWISTDKLNAKKGDIITLTFTYTGTKPIISIEFNMNFDNSLLELYNYEPINRACSNLNYNNDNSCFEIATLDVDKYYINKEEQFLNVQFRCMEDINRESIINFTNIYFYYTDITNYNFKEGYSVKLTSEFGLDISADKVNDIKKGDIVTLIFTYTGSETLYGFECFFSYDENLFEICNYEAIGIESDNLFYTPNGWLNILSADFINGKHTDENYIYKDKQFIKLQLKCLQDVKRKSEIKFFYPDFGYDTTECLEYCAKDYCYPIKLSLFGTDELSDPTGNAIAPNCRHLFNDYDYASPVSGSPVILYGNGINKKIDGNVVNNKQFTAYTDILPSYNYTLNSKGVVKPSSGKVIAGITTSSTKPVVSKNKIVDRDAAKIAKASIKSGQVTVTAAGKEKGLVYLWVIDTGKNGAYECCPVNVLMAPKKLELQNTSGSKLKNSSISQGGSLDVCVAGIAPGGSKTDDCTYTATVADDSQSYVKVTPVQGKNGQFKITATGLKNNKNTKVSITFTCNENKKKVKLAVTIKK